MVCIEVTINFQEKKNTTEFTLKNEQKVELLVPTDSNCGYCVLRLVMRS